ncbi:diguanylate cyclase [Sphingopyxis sp. H038]|nr:diguanylate cyclase [Sphingopyxis sp. H012]KTE06689.1 diguanylate cyclase [Sphingopyxis sp. H053]KTE08811.1 diguanylate cyclase [Sphingopyxis sp. H093]KTE28819.1 diguanylate cyclase [Sphingopyxis sp. H080]KTE32735.1 diguanylate cyclase [Sphingopyxis sp. H038]KTE39907.1 diguanylate cyclase [Sphingopyxis sp. H077]KTE39953.1 diguanylate cyclase [Sphingopyxis sp. H005]KTE63390.1 diguanylate cyclase [Sphingopyxis sp. H085]
MGKGRTKPSVMPIDRTGEDRPLLFVGWIDALPVPAALIRPMARGNFRLHASNAAFDRLSLSPAGVEAPIEMLRAIERASQYTDEAQEFSCQLGEGPAARDLRGSIGPLPTESGDDGLFLLTLIDRTQEMMTERNLRRELVSDSLTGLPNRAGFEELVEQRSITDVGAADHAILLLDLARFSRINEHIGPMAGDELIITVARRLKSSLRSGDILARTGGDEFAISTRVVGGRADVREMARRIRGCFDHPFRIGELKVSVDCALGCAIQPAADTDVADQIRHAQIALKRAKQTDRIEIYEPEAAMLSDNRFGMETELRNAIEEDRLHLAFQPLIELASGRVAGFEALARWDTSSGHSVSPTEFIPIAEDSGLIVPLGQWAIGKAAAVLADWDKQNGGGIVDCYFSVNVSAIQLVRDDVAAVVRQALESHKIGGERLMIELTESAIIGDPDLALSVLSELKALDARVAMDDFGTGYSNLAYLQRLPIDVLKIDRSFVEHMVDDRDKVAIVRTIQSLAEVLGMRTTAEGVETADQARLLSALGCDFGQGFLFARPMDGKDALDYWRQSLVRPIF